MGRPLQHPFVNGAEDGGPDGDLLITRAILRSRIRLLLADPGVAADVASRLGLAPGRRVDTPDRRQHRIGSENRP